MYRPAREWSALFYLKASPEMLSRLLVDQRFQETRTIQTNEFVRMVAFDLAPSPSVVSGAKVFEKRPPEDFVWHFAVVSADGTQLWLRVDRF